VVSIAAYANPSTLASNPRLRDALETAGVTVISVPPLRCVSIPAAFSQAFHKVCSCSNQSPSSGE